MSELILAIVFMIVVFCVLAGWALREDRRRHPPAEELPRLKEEEVA